VAPPNSLQLVTFIAAVIGGLNPYLLGEGDSSMIPQNQPNYDSIFLSSGAKILAQLVSYFWFVCARQSSAVFGIVRQRVGRVGNTRNK